MERIGEKVSQPDGSKEGPLVVVVVVELFENQMNEVNGSSLLHWAELRVRRESFHSGAGESSSDFGQAATSRPGDAKLRLRARQIGRASLRAAPKRPERRRTFGRRAGRLRDGAREAVEWAAAPNGPHTRPGGAQMRDGPSPETVRRRLRSSDHPLQSNGRRG